MNLIELSDIQEFKPISSNTDTSKKVDPFIKEAQDLDLRPIIGDEFYLDLVDDVTSSPSLTKYSDLWNGSTYTIGSNTYKNYGLKVVLVYYAYARYINRANTNSTAFGMVQKTNPNSEPITEKTLSRLYGQSISGAKAFEASVIKYLENNLATYPLYKCNKNNRRTGAGRISAIRRN